MAICLFVLPEPLECLLQEAIYSLVPPDAGLAYFSTALCLQQSSMWQCAKWQYFLVEQHTYCSWHSFTEHVPLARAQLQHVPDIASMGINPDHFRGAGEKPSEERAQKHEHYAAIYNQAGISLRSE